MVLNNSIMNYEDFIVGVVRMGVGFCWKAVRGPPCVSDPSITIDWI